MASRRRKATSRAPGGGVDQDFIDSLFVESAPETPAPKKIGTLERIQRNVSAGVDQAGISLVNAAQYGTNLVTGEDSPTLAGYSEVLKKRKAEVAPPDEGIPDKIIQGVTNLGLTFMLPGGVITKVGKLAQLGKVAEYLGIGIPALVQSAATGQDTYEQAIAQGMPEDQARSVSEKRAFVDLGIQGVTGGMAAGKFFTKAGPVKQVVNNAALGGVVSAAGTGASNVALDRPVTEGMGESTVVGAGVGGVVGGYHAVKMRNTYAFKVDPETGKTNLVETGKQVDPEQPPPPKEDKSITATAKKVTQDRQVAQQQVEQQRQAEEQRQAEIAKSDVMAQEAQRLAGGTLEQPTVQTGTISAEQPVGRVSTSPEFRTAKALESMSEQEVHAVAAKMIEGGYALTGAKLINKKFGGEATPMTEAEMAAIKKYIPAGPPKPLVEPVSQGVKSNWDIRSEGDWLATSKDAQSGPINYAKRILGSEYANARENSPEKLNPDALVTYSVTNNINERSVTARNNDSGIKIGAIELSKDGKVNHLVVAPEYQRKGIASEMVRLYERQTGKKIDYEGTPKRSKDFVKFLEGTEPPAEPSPPKPSKVEAKPFDDLHPTTKSDIAANLKEKVDFLKKNSEIDESDILQNLDGLADAPTLNVFNMPIRDIKGFNRTTSKVAVSNYSKMLKKSEAPPIIVSGDKFIDGGHRFQSYIDSGRDTVPVVDIGPLLSMNWEKYMAGEGASPKAKIPDLKPAKGAENAIKVTETTQLNERGGPQPVVRKEGRNPAKSSEGIRESGQGEKVQDLKPAPEAPKPLNRRQQYFADLKKQKEPTTAEPTAPKSDTLVPAIKGEDGKIVVGKEGQQHVDIYLENRDKGLTSAEKNRGFVTPEGKFLDRGEAMKWLKANEPDTVKNIPKRDNGKAKRLLHSEDLISARSKAAKPPVSPQETVLAPVAEQRPVEPVSQGGKKTHPKEEKAPSTLPKIPVEAKTKADYVAEAVFKDSPVAKAGYEKVKAMGKWLGRLVKEQQGEKYTDYVHHVQEWNAKQQASYQEADAIKKSFDKRVTDKKEREAIAVWAEYKGDEVKMQGLLDTVKDHRSRELLSKALNLSPEGKKLAIDARKILDDMGEAGKTGGVLDEFRNDYIPHRWKVKTNSNNFAKARTVNTIIEGIERGLTPRSVDVSELVSSYVHGMNKALADKALGADLTTGKWSDANPLALKAGTTKKTRSTEMTYVALKDNKQRGYEFHPEVAARLNNALGGSGIKAWYDNYTGASAEIPKAIIKAIDVGQREVKAMLLGGVPVPFHIIQEGTHAIGHGVNPFSDIPKIDLNANGGDNVHMDAARHGLMLAPDKVSVDSYIDGVGGRSVMEKVPGYGKILKDLNHLQFEVIIPGLKFKTYDKMVHDNTKTYSKEMSSGKMTLDDVKFLSATQVNAAFGHQNYVALGRSSTNQHFARLALLAPDFLEARMRFTGQAVKGLLGMKGGREQIKAMGRLALLNAGLAYGLAQITDGEWEGKNPFSFVKDGRRYGIRTVPEDIVMAATEPLKFFSGRINPVIGKMIQEFLFGIDWRGQKVSKGQAALDVTMSAIPLAVRPFTAPGKANPLSSLEQLSGMLGVRISRYSASAEMHDKVMEYMKESVDPKLNETAKRMEAETLPVSSYKALRDALLKGDTETAKEEYQTLLKTHEAKKIDQTMIKPRTFISKREDTKFYYSLDAEGRKLFDAAIAEKASLAEKYRAMIRR